MKQKCRQKLHFSVSKAGILIISIQIVLTFKSFRRKMKIAPFA